MQPRFEAVLVEGAEQLHEDNPVMMSTGALVPTTNVIADSDLALFFAGVECGLITLHRGARFNTADRPKPGGRWALLSRSKDGGWYNAEYLPQLAAYVDAILNLGYQAGRVMFELPAVSLQLDLAVLDDEGRVVVLGEAKRDNRMLSTLRADCLTRYAQAAPLEESKKRGDEVRQLAWRLWTVDAPYTWLIGPGNRLAYRTNLDPLALTELAGLPHAADIGLDHEPTRALTPPVLT